MSVRLDEDGIIRLEALCPVDEAEPLLLLLSADRTRVVDWRACDGLHTSLVQVLLRMRPVLRGPCRDSFLQLWVSPLLDRSLPVDPPASDVR
jgi:hypothetical protein